MPDTPTETRITVAQILVDLGYIKSRLDKLVDYDARLKKVERVVWMLSGVGSLVTAIVVPLAVSAIKKWLGL